MGLAMAGVAVASNAAAAPPSSTRAHRAVFPLRLHVWDGPEHSASGMLRHRGGALLPAAGARAGGAARGRLAGDASGDRGAGSAAGAGGAWITFMGCPPW